MAGTKRTQRTARETVDKHSQRSPRVNLRARLNENVSHISGNEYNVGAIVPSGSSLGYGSVSLAPGNLAGRANAAINGVGRYFQKGLYLPGTFVRYIPSVGLNTPGNIIIAWLDNPDMIRAWNLLSAGAHLNFIRDVSNAKTGPVWQELTVPLTQPPRRKTFMVDPQLDFQSNTEVDLSCQGLFIFCVFGTDISLVDDKTYGQLLVHCKMRFEEVKSFVTPQ